MAGRGRRRAVDALGRVRSVSDGAAAAVSVWEPSVDARLAGGFGATPLPTGAVVDTEIEPTKLVESYECAGEDVELAAEVGLAARDRSESRTGSIAETLLLTAAAIDADLLVAGTRGRGGFASLVLASVSNALVQHADRPILIVPPHAPARRRVAGTNHGSSGHTGACPGGPGGPAPYQPLPLPRAP